LSTLWPASGSTGGAVTTIANTMQVSVAPGTAAVALTTSAGTELCRWDAAEVPTPVSPAAPPTGSSRIDLVVLQVRDATLDAGSNNDFIFQVIPGTVATPGPGPVPAVPANAYPLAHYTVAGGSVNLNGVTVVDRRVPSLLPGQSTVKARAYRNAAWNTASVGQVPFDTANYDPLGGFNLATGTYTCPMAGDYLVATAYGLTAQAVGDICLARLDRTGGPAAFGSASVAAVATNNLNSAVSDIVPCVAGDTLILRHQSSVVRAGQTGTGATYMSVRLLA
jgi:hypothetical protein